jgi:hypothetical protein
MAFTRQHYIEVARILATVRDPHEKQRLAEEFARMFRHDNPAFDVERFSSAVFGEGGSRGRRARELAEARPRGAARGEHEAHAGFAVWTDPQWTIEDNARDRFSARWGDKEDRKRAIDAGMIDDDANTTITDRGWDQINKDVAQLERNSVAWLDKTFISSRAEGHGGHGGEELIGTVWFDPTNPEHAELIELAYDDQGRGSGFGRSERIDMNDASYGGLANSVWTGVSDFGASVLGGQIMFFDVSPEDIATMEQTLELADQQSKRGRR